MDRVMGCPEQVRNELHIGRDATHQPRCGADATMTTTAAFDASYECLTRKNALLLLIDHQIGPLWELEFASTRRRVVDLARFARELRVPTVVTAVAPETWGPIIPELQHVVGDESVIVRQMVNAWEEPRIRDAIEASGRRKLVLAGGIADVAVAVCALAAVGAGYEVYSPIDASGQCSHRALVRLSRAGVIVTTTSLVVNELAGDDWATRARTMRGEAQSPVRPSDGEMLRRRLRAARRGFR